MFISVKWKKRCVETGNISLFTFLQGLQLSSLWLLVKQNKNIEKIECNGKDRWKKQWNFIGVLRHWLRDKEIFTGDILILMKITGWSFISHQAPPPSPSSLQELRLGMRCVAWHQQKRARNEKNWERPRKKSLKTKKSNFHFYFELSKRCTLLGCQRCQPGWCFGTMITAIMVLLS